MGNTLRYAIVAVASATVALGANHSVRAWMTGHDAARSELHQLAHERLDLTPEQLIRVDRLETEFGNRKRTLDDQLRATNAQLAAAMASEHQYGPKVASAIDHSHAAMGELQKETLRHVFAMRAVLDPAQARMFDDEIGRVLTAPGQH